MKMEVEKVARRHYMDYAEFYKDSGISFHEFLKGVVYYINIGISSVEEACEATDYDYM